MLYETRKYKKNKNQNNITHNMKRDEQLEKARKKAKELEKTPIPTTEEIVEIYKDGMEEAEKLKKLLKPQWFLDDKCLKTKKSLDKPTRKKKSL